MENKQTKRKDLITKDVILCRLGEIAEPGSKGISLGQGASRREIFLVRHGGEVRGYENSCPHTGGMLDWVPDQFLSYDRKHILCATHGALFRINDGHCLHGPCVGRSLSAVAIRLEGDKILLLDDPPFMPIIA